MKRILAVIPRWLTFWSLQLLPACVVGISVGYWKGRQVGLVVGSVLSIMLIIHGLQSLREQKRRRRENIEKSLRAYLPYLTGSGPDPSGQFYLVNKRPHEQNKQ